MKKWGNSAAVRIPASVMQATHLKLGQLVEVEEENGRIVIETHRPRVFLLKDLLDGITPANLHHPVDTGSPGGQEVS